MREEIDMRTDYCEDGAACQHVDPMTPDPEGDVNTEAANDR